MIKAPNKIIKREIVLADGRYLILYTFEPADRLGSPPPADPMPDAETATRMMGGGFGGCTINLVDSEKLGCLPTA